MNTSYRFRRRLVGVVLLLLAAVIAPYVLVNAPALSLLGNQIPFNLATLSYAGVASVAVLSLVLLVGFNGQLSLAAGLFVGLGAYLTTIIADRLPLPLVVAALLAALGCAALGAVIGLPALRIRGAYLALVTITMAAVFPALVRLPSVKPYTGGSNGLALETATHPPSWLPVGSGPELLGHIPGIGPFFIGTRPLGHSQADAVWVYFVILASVAVVFWMVTGVLRGRVGRAVVAVRDNEISAAANGVDVARAKVTVFALSGAVGGLAGALYAVLYRIIAPDNFGLTLAIYLLFGMILGGYRSISGAVIGGLAVAYLPAITGQIDHIPGMPDRYLTGPTASLTLGLLLVMFPVLMPGGAVERFRRGRRTSARDVADPKDAVATPTPRRQAASVD